MFKKIVFALSVCLLSFVVHAQTDDIARILQGIEQNNLELKAFSSLMESKQLELKAGNNLPDPQAGAYYLPWGDNNTGNYSEFEITQSFEFPTVYSARSSLIEKQQVQQELEYATRRQAILLPAKQAMLDLIFLNKKIAIEQARAIQAKKVSEQVQELFDKEQVGILEVNKAQIAWMQEQFKVDLLDTKRNNILLLLRNMNGGIEVTLDQSDFYQSLKLAEMDSIWQNMQLTDPSIRVIKLQEEVALQQTKLTKNEALPNLSIGYNHQGVSGDTYSGIYGGLSIPLWSNRHRVKAAEAKYQYQQSYSNVQSLSAYLNFQKKYTEYQILLNKFNEYQTMLTGITSDVLMFEAYEFGEISFLAYYVELQFYRTAFDSMLEMERALYKLKADILKHQL